MSSSIFHVELDTLHQVSSSLKLLLAKFIFSWFLNRRKSTDWTKLARSSFLSSCFFFLIIYLCSSNLFFLIYSLSRSSFYFSLLISSSFFMTWIYSLSFDSSSWYCWIGLGGLTVVNGGRGPNTVFLIYSFYSIFFFSSILFFYYFSYWSWLSFIACSSYFSSSVFDAIALDSAMAFSSSILSSYLTSISICLASALSKYYKFYFLV